MPRPTDADGAYLPALDGVRALAVGAVVAYHLGVAQLPGGLLGVGIFFTLSGYLITGLLRSTWERTGGLDLRRFWLRRARRLLPAVVLLLVVVMAVTALSETPQLEVRTAESLAALLYVSNWTTIHLGVSYFARFDGPGPLDHLWSLSVEEQFYVVWPLLLWLLVTVLRRRWDRVALATLGLAGVSFVLLWLLAATGFDHTRAYEGTDTRAGGLLVGAALGLMWRPARLPRQVPVRGRVVLEGVGLAALTVIALLLTRTDQYSLSLYRGGLLLLSLATAALIAAATHPASIVGRVVGVLPLRWLGERSYGIYLWHLPVIVVLPQPVLQHSAWRPVLLLAITLTLAAASWSLVEDPIRRRGLLGALRRGREHRIWSGPQARTAARGPAPALLLNVLALALVATAALTGLTVLAPASPVSTSAAASHAGTTRGDLNDPPLPPPVTDPPPTTSGPTPTATATASATTAGPPTAVSAPMTSCTSVAHIGDSTSVGLVNKDYLPTAAYRIDAQYTLVGVQNVLTDILGARSIVERFQNQPNAEDAVEAKVAAGYRGCWVFAMGINEVANQVVGGVWPYDRRIDLLMKHVGSAPVLWLTVRTLVPTGPYAGWGMPAWNAALQQACQRYPTMRVYDWASEVQDAWFIGDQIHYTTSGYQQRSHRIARALAAAFPENGPASPGCLVRTP